MERPQTTPPPRVCPQNRGQGQARTRPGTVGKGGSLKK